MGVACRLVNQQATSCLGSLSLPPVWLSPSPSPAPVAPSPARPQYAAHRVCTPWTSAAAVSPVPRTSERPAVDLSRRLEPVPGTCIFPFTYEGVTHNKCTNAGSENGASWCATEVDESGEVVRNTWEDCDLA